MFWFKACPKCRGDLVLAVDIHGSYVYCFQCAFIPYPPVKATPVHVLIKQRTSKGGRHQIRSVA